MEKKSLAIFLTVFVVLGFVGIVRATPITYRFSGNITSLADPFSRLSEDVNIGSPFFGYFSYDSESTPDYGYPRETGYVGGQFSINISNHYLYQIDPSVLIG